MKSRHIFVAALALLTACEDDNRIWQNRLVDHSNQTTWDKDHYECTRENTSTKGAIVSRGVVFVDQGVDTTMLETCMKVRGWYVAGRKR